MLNFNPDLVLVHYSGFRQESSDGPRLKLKLLIEYFVDSETKFLIYSRAEEKMLREKVDGLLADLYNRKPDLVNRIEVFGLLDHGRPSWQDPIVASNLKLRVKEILDVE